MKVLVIGGTGALGGHAANPQMRGNWVRVNPVADVAVQFGG